MNDRELEPIPAEYECVIEAIAGAPRVEPTAAECAALAKALAEVELCPVVERSAVRTAPQGLPGFALASALVFILLAGVLGMQAFGVISIVPLASSIGPFTIVLTAIVVVFVTSFVPIAVTARRRPLNGMTFRR